MRENVNDCCWAIRSLQLLRLAMIEVFWYKVALCVACASFRLLSALIFIKNPAFIMGERDHG